MTRPPTLRDKKRYVLARIDPAGTIPDAKDLYYAISDAVTALWGDAVAATVVPAVIAVENGFVFVRCMRGSERELMIAMTTVTACRDAKIALRITAVSGTMEGLRSRVQKIVHLAAGKEAAGDGDGGAQPTEPQATTGPGQEIAFAGATFIVQQCKGGKVDVIEKGFKNTNRLYLTSEDMESV
jgi:ribonuclease P/MRP protein subunit POP5